MKLFARKEKMLGKAEKRRGYDLPLQRDGGTGFVVTLSALMVFMAFLALAASFILGAMTARWSSGLEGAISIEIPAEDAAGKIRSRESLIEEARSIEGLAAAHPGVESAHALNAEEITALVLPWLGGEAQSLSNLPLPGLVSIKLASEAAPADIRVLEKKIKALAPQARIDRHESWLGDVLRFTGALKLGAYTLLLVTGATLAMAVAGAVRARLAVFADQVELLHLMGASDGYVSGQFQRHAFHLTTAGALAGVMAGALVLIVMSWMGGRMDVSLVPSFRLQTMQIVMLALLPAVTGLIAVVTTRRTVRQVLERMP